MRLSKSSIIIMVSLVVVILIVVLLHPGGGDAMITEYLTQSMQKATEWDEITTFDTTQMTSEPKFDVGERYVYKVWLNHPINPNGESIKQPYEYTTKIVVDGIERINKTEYYVLQEENRSIYPSLQVKDEYGIWKTATSTNPLNLGGCILKISKDNGRILVTPTPGTMCVVLEEMTIYWEYDILLYLDENKKFTIGAEIGGVGGILGRDAVEFEVKGIEEMKGRRCFRLETERKYERGGMMKIHQRGIYWVDVDKRIPVKVERYEGDTLMRDIELERIEA